MSSLSTFSTILRQLVLGSPLLRLPSGVQRIAILAMLLLPSRSTCPIHLHLLLATKVTDILVVGLLQKLVIGYFLGPEDSQNLPEASLSIRLFFLAG